MPKKLFIRYVWCLRREDQWKRKAKAHRRVCWVWSKASVGGRSEARPEVREVKARAGCSWAEWTWGRKDLGGGGLGWRDHGERGGRMCISKNCHIFSLKSSGNLIQDNNDITQRSVATAWNDDQNFSNSNTNSEVGHNTGSSMSLPTVIRGLKKTLRG